MSYSSTILADSPLGYWRLGESSGTTAFDASPHGQDGTYTATYTQGVAGLISGDPDTAVTFTSGYVTTPSIATGTGDMSLEIWLKSPAPQSGNVAILMCGAAKWLGLTSGVLTWNLEVTATGRIDDNARHHVVMTRESGVVKLYQDGSLAATGGGGDSSNQTGAMLISAFAGGIAQYLGTPDEAAVYGTALSSARVAAHYADGTTGGGATSYTAPASPTTIAVGATTTATITPNGTYTGTITGTPSGSASTGLSAVTKTFSGPATPQTASWMPTVAGTLTITWSNSGGLTNAVNDTITVATGTIAITSPVANQFRWRGAGGSASLTIAGAYTGTPGSIEWSHDGGSTWATLVASPSAGSYSASVTLATGQYTLSVRFSADHAVTASVTPVSVAYVLALPGQSQWGTGTNAQMTIYDANGYVHAMAVSGGYSALADPAIGAGSGGMGPGTPVLPMVTCLAQLLNAPIGVIPCAVGGTTVSAWQSGGGEYNSMKASIVAAGGCDGLLMWLGESDAEGGTSTATFHAGIAALVASAWSDFAAPTLWCKLEGQDTSTVPTANRDAINAAIVQAWGDVAHCLPGPDFSPTSTEPEDSLHFKPDSKLNVVGGMWAIEAYKQLFQPSGGTAVFNPIGCGFIRGV